MRGTGVCVLVTVLILAAPGYGQRPGGAAPARVEGAIQEIGDDHVTLLTSELKALAAELRPQTRVRIGDREADPADLRLGQKVSLDYEWQGSRCLARLVIVQQE